MCKHYWSHSELFLTCFTFVWRSDNNQHVVIICLQNPVGEWGHLTHEKQKSKLNCGNIKLHWLLYIAKYLQITELRNIASARQQFWGVCLSLCECMLQIRTVQIASPTSAWDVWACVTTQTKITAVILCEIFPDLWEEPSKEDCTFFFFSPSWEGVSWHSLWTNLISCWWSLCLHSPWGGGGSCNTPGCYSNRCHDPPCANKD